MSIRLPVPSAVASAAIGAALALSSPALANERAPMSETTTPPIAEQRPYSFERHGVTIADPWHWLKDEGYPKVDDADVRAYLEAENRWFEAAISANPPPAPGGKRIKLRYITQNKTRPPTFVLFGTRLDDLPESYRRYLVNGIRRELGFGAVPVRLTLRSAKNPYATK